MLQDGQNVMAYMINYSISENLSMYKQICYREKNMKQQYWFSLYILTNKCTVHITLEYSKKEFSHGYLFHDKFYLLNEFLLDLISWDITFLFVSLHGNYLRINYIRSLFLIENKPLGFIWLIKLCTSVYLKIIDGMIQCYFKID